MSLQLTEGFEALPQVSNNAIPSSSSIATIVGRDGVGKAVGPWSGTSNLLIPFPTNQAVTIIGMGVKFAAAGNGAKIVDLMADNAATTHVRITSTTDAHISIARGASPILQTSTLSFAPGAWHYLEIKITISDTVGTVIVKLDGVEFINFTGDTKNGGTLSSIGGMYLYPNTNDMQGYDDIYVLDGVDGTTLSPAQSQAYNDFIGERVIKGIRPAGNGAFSQLLGADGDSVNNYAQVNSDPFSLLKYVAGSTAGNRDTYDMAALSGLSSVDSIKVLAYGAKTDSGSRSVKTITRALSGVEALSSAQPLSTTPTVLQGPIRTKDPDGNNWTQARVNSSEFGVEVA